MAQDLTQVRIAENQSTFRRANEQIERAAAEVGLRDEAPFICECPEPTCTQIILLGLTAYADVRSDPRRFFSAPGHEAISVEAGAGVVVERHADYVLVEKIGVAGDLAAEAHERDVKSDG